MIYFMNVSFFIHPVAFDLLGHNVFPFLSSTSLIMEASGHSISTLFACGGLV